MKLVAQSDPLPVKAIRLLSSFNAKSVSLFRVTQLMRRVTKFLADGFHWKRISFQTLWPSLQWLKSFAIEISAQCLLCVHWMLLPVFVMNISAKFQIASVSRDSISKGYCWCLMTHQMALIETQWKVFYRTKIWRIDWKLSVPSSAFKFRNFLVKMSKSHNWSFIKISTGSSRDFEKHRNFINVWIHAKAKVHVWKDRHSLFDVRGIKSISSFEINFCFLRDELWVVKHSWSVSMRRRRCSLPNKGEKPKKFSK